MRFVDPEVFAHELRQAVLCHRRGAIQICGLAYDSFSAPSLEKRGLARWCPDAWSFLRTTWEWEHLGQRQREPLADPRRGQRAIGHSSPLPRHKPSWKECICYKSQNHSSSECPWSFPYSPNGWESRACVVRAVHCPFYQRGRIG